MTKRKIICFIIIFYITPSGGNEDTQKDSLLSKLVRHNETPNNQTIGIKYKPIEEIHANLKCKYKCITSNELVPKFLGQNQARFIDQGTNDSLENNEMEAPAGKFSIFNLLPDDEEEDDDHDSEDSVKNEEEEDGDDDDEEEEDVNDEYDFNFFGPDEDIATDKIDGTKQDSLLKQYHRQRFRMHNLVFPLLLAYKLKFFMVIPLLLGSLVLLIGTTGIAGFFFALFSAALGIHVKMHEH